MDDAAWLWLLWPLSMLVRAVVYIRRKRFLVYPPADSKTPVVVVGGITVGGTGKTPVIIALVHALTGSGLKVAVVSRGYGGTVIDSPQTVSARASAKAVGDEPTSYSAALRLSGNRWQRSSGCSPLCGALWP